MEKQTNQSNQLVCSKKCQICMSANPLNGCDLQIEYSTEENRCVPQIYRNYGVKFVVLKRLLKHSLENKLYKLKKHGIVLCRVDNEDVIFTLDNDTGSIVVDGRFFSACICCGKKNPDHDWIDTIFLKKTICPPESILQKRPPFIISPMGINPLGDIQICAGHICPTCSIFEKHRDKDECNSCYQGIEQIKTQYFLVKKTSKFPIRVIAQYRLMMEIMKILPKDVFKQIFDVMWPGIKIFNNN